MTLKDEREIKKFFERVQTFRKERSVNARLGDLLNGILKADDGRFYATLITGQVVKVKNNRVPSQMGWPIKIGYQSGSHLLQVLETWDIFSDQSIPDIPSHSETQQWPSIDTLWVRGEQILPGLFVPSTGLILQVYGFVYFISDSSGGLFHLLPNQEIDMTAYIPGSDAKFILIEVDDAGGLHYTSGSTVASRALLEYEHIPPPTNTFRPLVAVKVYFGQTEFIKNADDTDIIDLRWAGFGSGGQATAIEWADILNVPTEFNPDITVTNPLYPRIYTSTVAPTVNEDSSAGYKRGDVIIDTVALVVYQAASVAIGAAVWYSGGSGSGSGGGGDINIRIDGALAVAPNVYYVLITKDTTSTKVYITCDNPGTAGSTIVDVHLNGTTIFTTQANRPTLAYNDANGWAYSGAPDVVSFVEGDILIIDIDQIATGAEGLTLVLQGDSTGTAVNNNAVIAGKLYMSSNFR